MRTLTGGLLCALLLAAPVAAGAQQIRAGAVELEFDGRVQVQFNTTSVDEADLLGNGSAVPGFEIPYSTFETRRVRLTANLAIDDWMRAKIQPDFALGRLSLKDAWVEYLFSDAARLRVGQFKKPFSLLELTSSTTFPVIERGVRIRGLETAYGVRSAALTGMPLTRFDGTVLVGDEQALLGDLGYLGRDLGAALHGASGRFGYSIGVFNGAGADVRDDNDSKAAAGRLEYRPVAGTPLTLGAAGSYSSRFFGGEVDGIDVPPGSPDGLAFEVDAEWGEFRRPGLHLLAELATGDNYFGRVHAGGVTSTGLSDARFLGAQAVAAVFRAIDGDRVEGVEPALRVGFADPNRGRDDDHAFLLTPGLNLYFFGRNRLMLNWDVFVPGGDGFDTEHAIRAQAQAHF